MQDRRYILIHGTEGSPDANWLPWLAENLRGHASERGAGRVQVVVPAFPTPQGQSLENWREGFGAQCGAVDGKTVLIGHSIGCALILRLLESSPQPAAGAYLVAGWTGMLAIPELQPLISTFFERDFEWERIKANGGRIIQYHGTDDPYVPLQRGVELALKLGATLKIIPEGGHLNSAAGFDRFEQLLSDLTDSAPV